MKITNPKTIGGILLALSLAPATVHAAQQINGGISFGGSYTAKDSANNVVSDLTLADKLVPTANFVIAANGDFSSIPPFTPTASAAVLDVNPAIAPPDPVWSVGGFSLTLSSMTEPSVTGNTLELDGSGILHSTNSAFQDTPCVWIATFNTAAGTFSWSSSSLATPVTCNCTLTFNSPAKITNCAGDTIPDVTASQDCGSGPTSVPVVFLGAVTNGICPQIITRTNSATDSCGTAHIFVQTITVNCSPDCTITTSVTSTTVGATGLMAAVADAGPGATYSWNVLNGSITSGQGTPNLVFSAGTDTNNPVSVMITVTSAAGCQSTCSASVLVTPKSAACTITGVTISDTSWNKFNIPNGTSPLVWVHAHLNGIKGIPTTGVTTVQFVGVSITLDGTSYSLPDGVMTFDSSAPATITTTFSGGKWNTLINPKNLSDEMFFTGAAIPVTPAIAAGAKATLTYTTLSSVQGISFSWQWSAAVYTFWPSDWNQAMIQPFHQSLHAGTPLNTTVQKSLIQGPRGGGGSNFTGSWSATGTAACQ